MLSSHEILVLASGPDGPVMPFCSNRLSASGPGVYRYLDSTAGSLFHDMKYSATFKDSETCTAPSVQGLLACATEFSTR